MIAPWNCIRLMSIRRCLVMQRQTILVYRLLALALHLIYWLLLFQSKKKSKTSILTKENPDKGGLSLGTIFDPFRFIGFDSLTVPLEQECSVLDYFLVMFCPKLIDFTIHFCLTLTWASFSSCEVGVSLSSPVFPFELSAAKYVFKNHWSPSCRPLLTRINKAWNVLFNLSFLGWKWKWNKFFRSLVFKIPVLTKIDWVVD